MGEEWKQRLAGLSKSLVSEERAEVQKKAALTVAFRSWLAQIEPVVQSAVQFGDAYGAECDYEVSRFDERYPTLRFRVRKPLLYYVVECRDGLVLERVKEGDGAPRQSVTTLDSLSPKLFEQRLTAWVQAAAQANRKPPRVR